MEFTKDLLKKLNEEGKEIGIYSKEASKILFEVHKEKFNDYSSRSYYYWRSNKKAIPTNIVLSLMKIENKEKIEIEYFSVGGGNKVKTPKEEKIEFSYFLGLLLGDGCLIKSKKSINKSTYLVQITFRTKKEAINTRKISKSLFEIDSSIYRGRGCFNLTIHSKPLVLVLHKKYQIPIGFKYKNLVVPDLIKNSSKIHKMHFIKGIIESDGNIYLHRRKKCIQLRQKSIEFLIEIKELLKEMRIEFNHPYYDKANNSWLLWSSKKELVNNFIKELSQLHLRSPGSSAWIEHLPSNKE